MADINDLLRLTGRGKSGSITDVKNNRERYWTQRNPDVDNPNPDDNRNEMRLEAIKKHGDSLQQGYKFPEGDTSPTMRDRFNFKTNDPVGFSAQRGQQTWKDVPDAMTESRMDWRDQFGQHSMAPQGSVPLPEPRKPWLIPHGQFQNERSMGRGQELPPGVSVRPSDASQIQQDLHDPDDEEVLNHIMEGIGSMKR